MAERCLEREGAEVQPRPAKQRDEESGPRAKPGLGDCMGEGPRAWWLLGLPGHTLQGQGQGEWSWGSHIPPPPLLWAERRLQSPVLGS